MDRDTKQLIGWTAAWMFLLWQTAKIGGGIGLTLFASGTALMLMYAYIDHKLEQAQKQARKRIAPYSAKLNEAYKNKEVFK